MMNVTLLKFRWLFLFIVLVPVAVKAQDPRFIYIQTDNKQPFYVKLDKKYLSSSATGYIIIPKLTAGNYQLNIGFPKTELPELQATIQVKEANAGYLLKRSGDKDWSLINLQTMEPVAVQKQAQVSKEQVVVIAGDEFSRILAEVVNDPSINQVMVVKKDAGVKEDAPVIKKEEKPVKQETVKQDAPKPAVPPVMAVSTVKKETEPVTIKEEPVAVKTVKQELPGSAVGSSVVKLSQDSTSGGVLMAYIDRSDLGDDTVKVFIPVSSSTKPATAAAKTLTVKTEPAKQDKRFIDMELQNPNSKPDTTAAHKEDVVITETKKQPEPVIEKIETKEPKQDITPVTTNTACKQTATQSDVSKLRKQMSAEDNERNMTKTASKQFALTCFTTEQIKNLGGIFITEDERYKFYVAAFPYVADRQNFAALEEQLTDIYYKTRFKAMLAH